MIKNLRILFDKMNKMSCWLGACCIGCLSILIPNWVTIIGIAVGVIVGVIVTKNDGGFGKDSVYRMVWCIVIGYIVGAVIGGIINLVKLSKKLKE